MPKVMAGGRDLRHMRGARASRTLTGAVQQMHYDPRQLFATGCAGRDNGAASLSAGRMHQ
jgi:hypothetical protein